MKYHVISTSNSGHGAVFTNLKDAQVYMKTKPESVYSVFDQMPNRIPPKNAPSAKQTVSLKTDSSDPITIYTDGSSIGNPGPGGYGIVIIIDGKTTEISQGYRHTTNNRMEMMAVITALEKLEATDQPVTVYSDSQYTINGIVKGWAKNWKKKGWKKSDGKPALNPDLWERMLEVTARFPKLSFQWVRGHAGDPLNELADSLANGAAQGTDGLMLDDEGYR